MSLKFMEQMPLKPELMTCPKCGKEKRIGLHSYQERRTICHGQVELGQAQADEMCVNTRRGKVWMAMTVFSRLFLWGQVGAHRTKGLIECVMTHDRGA